MKFYTLGESEQPVILLLPGTCCHWKLNFGEVIPRFWSMSSMWSACPMMEQYTMLLERAIVSFQIVGGVVSALSGLALIFSERR